MNLIKELTKNDFHKILYKRADDSHKGSFGYVALIGGSEKYSGAIRLAYLANACMRSGCGVCKVAAPKNLFFVVAKNILEATFFPLSCDRYDFLFNEKEFDLLINNTKVVAIGMGIGDTIETKKAIIYLLEKYDGVLLIDADGINALSKIDDSYLINTKSKIILTPHIKEFYRLLCFKKESINIDFYNMQDEKTALSIIKQKVLDLAIDFASYYKVNLLVKGSENIITDGINCYMIKKGSAGMATGGSGDVLSGIMSAIVGYNTNDILLAMAVAVYINGYAGEKATEKYGEISMIASDTVNQLSEVIRELSNE